MFFRERIAGEDFGMACAEAIDTGFSHALDKAISQRLARFGCAPKDSYSRDVERRFSYATGVELGYDNFKDYSFSFILVYSMKELILLSCDDKNNRKINSGFQKYINETFDIDDDMKRNSDDIRISIESDYLFTSKGWLREQKYDIEDRLEQQAGISPKIAKIIMDNCFIDNNYESKVIDSIMSLVIREYEKLFLLLAEKYKKYKII